MADVIKGHHFFEPYKTVLIQIQDVCTWKFAEPAYKDGFIYIHQFEFMDHDDPEDDANITVEQAEKIASILKTCQNLGQNVVVHCHAGLCRSGAVAEIGVMMGFQDTEMPRQPNVLVKRRLRDAIWGKPDYEDIFAQPLNLKDWE